MRHLALKGLSDVFATIKKLNLPFLYPPWNVVPRLELPVKNNELNFEWGGGGGGIVLFYAVTLFEDNGATICCGL